jgi:hypothetical protein
MNGIADSTAKMTVGGMEDDIERNHSSKKIKYLYEKRLTK